MNTIVLIALKRPYTFAVLAILILIFGGRAALRTPTDIFPNIGIPVVAVVWTYNGLTPEDMSGRVVYYYERALTTTVSNIEHIESDSLYGRGIIKTYFQPGTDVAAAQAQVTAVSQTVLKQLPAGITPPLVLSYNASSVSVLALQVSAEQLTTFSMRIVEYSMRLGADNHLICVHSPRRYSTESAKLSRDTRALHLAIDRWKNRSLCAPRFQASVSPRSKGGLL
jgi:multidrug efflux pump subunit AcrB